MKDVEKLAREFSESLRTEIMLNRGNLRDGAEIFDNMVREHIEGDWNNRLSCISYQYVPDAKQTMVDAFEGLLGFAPDGMSDIDNIVMNSAWKLAKENNFYS